MGRRTKSRNQILRLNVAIVDYRSDPKFDYRSEHYSSAIILAYIKLLLRSLSYYMIFFYMYLPFGTPFIRYKIVSDLGLYELYIS